MEREGKNNGGEGRMSKRCTGGSSLPVSGNRSMASYEMEENGDGWGATDCEFYFAPTVGKWLLYLGQSARVGLAICIMEFKFSCMHV